jgi:hypothetical protein
VPVCAGGRGAGAGHRVLTTAECMLAPGTKAACGVVDGTPGGLRPVTT